MFKICLFLQQLSIAKDLNGEPPLPFDLNKFFNANSSNNNQIANRQQQSQSPQKEQRHKANNHLEPQNLGPSHQPVPIYIQQSSPFQQGPPFQDESFSRVGPPYPYQN